MHNFRYRFAEFSNMEYDKHVYAEQNELQKLNSELFNYSNVPAKITLTTEEEDSLTRKEHWYVRELLSHIPEHNITDKALLIKETKAILKWLPHKKVTTHKPKKDKAGESLNPDEASAFAFYLENGYLSFDNNFNEKILKFIVHNTYTPIVEDNVKKYTTYAMLKNEEKKTEGKKKSTMAATPINQQISYPINLNNPSYMSPTSHKKKVKSALDRALELEETENVPANIQESDKGKKTPKAVDDPKRSPKKKRKTSSDSQQMSPHSNDHEAHTPPRAEMPVRSLQTPKTLGHVSKQEEDKAIEYLLSVELPNNTADVPVLSIEEINDQTVNDILNTIEKIEESAELEVAANQEISETETFQPTQEMEDESQHIPQEKMDTNVVEIADEPAQKDVTESTHQESSAEDSQNSDVENSDVEEEAPAPKKSKPKLKNIARDSFTLTKPPPKGKKTTGRGKKRVEEPLPIVDEAQQNFYCSESFDSTKSTSEAWLTILKCKDKPNIAAFDYKMPQIKKLRIPKNKNSYKFCIPSAKLDPKQPILTQIEEYFSGFTQKLKAGFIRFSKNPTMYEYGYFEIFDIPFCVCAGINSAFVRHNINMLKQNNYNINEYYQTCITYEEGTPYFSNLKKTFTFFEIFDDAIPHSPPMLPKSKTNSNVVGIDGFIVTPSVVPVEPETVIKKPINYSASQLKNTNIIKAEKKSPTVKELLTLAHSDQATLKKYISYQKAKAASEIKNKKTTRKPVVLDDAVQNLINKLKIDNLLDNLDEDYRISLVDARSFIYTHKYRDITPSNTAAVANCVLEYLDKDPRLVVNKFEAFGTNLKDTIAVELLSFIYSNIKSKEVGHGFPHLIPKLRAKYNSIKFNVLIDNFCIQPNIFYITWKHLLSTQINPKINNDHIAQCSDHCLLFLNEVTRKLVNLNITTLTVPAAVKYIKDHYPQLEFPTNLDINSKNKHQCLAIAEEKLSQFKRKSFKTPQYVTLKLSMLDTDIVLVNAFSSILTTHFEYIENAESIFFSGHMRISQDKKIYVNSSDEFCETRFCCSGKYIFLPQLRQVQVNIDSLQKYNPDSLMDFYGELPKDSFFNYAVQNKRYTQDDSAYFFRWVKLDVSSKTKVTLTTHADEHAPIMVTKNGNVYCVFPIKLNSRTFYQGFVNRHSPIRCYKIGNIDYTIVKSLIYKALYLDDTPTNIFNRIDTKINIKHDFYHSILLYALYNVGIQLSNVFECYDNFSILTMLKELFKTKVYNIEDYEDDAESDVEEVDDETETESSSSEYESEEDDGTTLSFEPPASAKAVEGKVNNAEAKVDPESTTSKKRKYKRSRSSSESSGSSSSSSSGSSASEDEAVPEKPEAKSRGVVRKKTTKPRTPKKIKKSAESNLNIKSKEIITTDESSEESDKEK